jgi:S-methylmethionine-dependent homocysteine/selenocysteine methylase
MPRYRDALPQLANTVFLTDTGIETTLIDDGFDLPYFAAMTLLRDEAGRARLDRYFLEHAQVAAQSGTGFIIESATWRASADWGSLLGYSRAALADANRVAVEGLVDLRSHLDSEIDLVVSGCIGPRGEGYDPTEQMAAKHARDYHTEQVETFAGTDADMVHAMTMTYPDEAIGVVLAAREAEIPVVISFTVETDGVLPDGTGLGQAIERVDDATGGAAAYFAVNCAHPTHFANVLDAEAAWTQRLRGVRANASRTSAAEQHESESMDADDPIELGAQYADLRRRDPNLTILGGCCGTDVRHLRAIADTLTG